MLLKLEKSIPISHVTLETVPKYANIERPTSSQLYASTGRYLIMIYILSGAGASRLNNITLMHLADAFIQSDWLCSHLTSFFLTASICFTL